MQLVPTTPVIGSFLTTVMRCCSEFPKRVMTVSVLLTLTACGGNSGESPAPLVFPGLPVYGVGDQDPADASGQWLVSLSLFRSTRFPNSGDARVATLDYGSSFTLKSHIDHYVDQWESDTCTIEGTSPNTGGGGGDIPYVSGGSSVVLNTPSGPWYTIPQQTDFQYRLDDELAGALPAGATLSIPGAEFPTVSAYPLYAPVDPQRNSPAWGTPVTINSEYTWVPDNDPETVMTLTFREYDSEGNYVRYADVYCQMVDDGAFTMPQDVLAMVEASEVDLQVRYVRRVRRMDYVNGIAFFQLSSVGE